MGRQGAEPDPLVRKWFKLLELLGVKKPIAECQACFRWRRAQNTSRQRAHLLSECLKYQELASASDRVKFRTQTTLDCHLPTIDEAKKTQLDQKLALAIYVTGKAFASFKDPAWIDFFAEFSYKPPTKQALAGPLLNHAYTEIKEEVEAVVEGGGLSLVTDESTDVSLNRLANYSFLTPDGSSFY